MIIINLKPRLHHTGRRHPQQAIMEDANHVAKLAHQDLQDRQVERVFWVRQALKGQWVLPADLRRIAKQLS
jgi:hypothetical protein